MRFAAAARRTRDFVEDGTGAISLTLGLQARAYGHALQRDDHVRMRALEAEATKHESFQSLISPSWASRLSLSPPLSGRAQTTMAGLLLLEAYRREINRITQGDALRLKPPPEAMKPLLVKIERERDRRVQECITVMAIDSATDAWMRSPEYASMPAVPRQRVDALLVDLGVPRKSITAEIGRAGAAAIYANADLLVAESRPGSEANRTVVTAAELTAQAATGALLQTAFGPAGPPPIKVDPFGR